MAAIDVHMHSSLCNLVFRKGSSVQDSDALVVRRLQLVAIV